MTGGSAALSTLTRAVPVLDSDTVVFEHVLAGVGLSGPAARLAGMLQAGFLAEAGWDPAERVVSPPAEHPLLGRTLCRVGGCLSTAHGTKTGGVCWRCFTWLTGQGFSVDGPTSGLRSAISRTTPPRPSSRTPNGSTCCAGPGI